MTCKSSHSKELLFVSILGALLGGAGTALLMSKEGEKLKKNVEGTYTKVKDNIQDVLYSLEEKLNEKAGEFGDELSEGWTETVTQTLDQLKKKLENLNLFEPKDLGMVILLFTLLGAILGAGTTLVIQDKTTKDDDLFQGIASRIASAQPLLSEIRNLLNETSRSHSGDPLDAHKNTTTNDLLEFALLGLKLWDRVKARNS